MTHETHVRPSFAVFAYPWAHVHAVAGEERLSIRGEEFVDQKESVPLRGHIMVSRQTCDGAAPSGRVAGLRVAAAVKCA